MDRSLIIWISVSTLVGMRFSISRSNGRISCEAARFSRMTNMFSFSRTVAAGRSFGTFIGIRCHS